MRQLTDKEIERFASGKDVKKVAVENFLSTLDPEIGSMGNTMNAQMDARMYKWNTATVRAINAGIMAACKSEPQIKGKFGGSIVKAIVAKSKKTKDQVKGGVEGLGGLWESLGTKPTDIGTEIGYYCKKTKKPVRKSK
jgi:hypothetical protein